MTIAARVSDVSIAFGGQSIVSKVSLEVPARKISVLIGRSGSGKTTFLRAFNRLNEETADCTTTGNIQIDVGSGLEAQMRACGGSLMALRLKVGMLFQTPNVLPVSIGRNVAMPLEKLMRLSRYEIHHRVEKSLRDVGLWPEVCDRLNTSASLLSGGQQQRLCLARALALEPQILLLDEPTASLDILASARIEALLKELAETYTVIMVSHSLSQACRLADRLFVFDDGRLVKTLNDRQEMEEERLALMIASLAESALK
ncbi:Phosphate import ATP-binding protein PstB 3 [Leminorella richardii]|uniref:Phosphate import ATP-binding protein PstB 3 n=1 Tax=Leminorella richardii TaxID=158841 RepID=A0A2X4UJK6_9GAMM|nr:phosphate ABC transporter ATP-binding protein [Leminorella richardii]SQI40057.1 Phosphate import ATP-binding protein PstB 3 [Leminorella richardii]